MMWTADSAESCQENKPRRRGKEQQTGVLAGRISLEHCCDFSPVLRVEEVQGLAAGLQAQEVTDSCKSRFLIQTDFQGFISVISALDLVKQERRKGGRFARY